MNKRLMRVVVFFSEGASSLKYLWDNDPNLGKKYEIVGAFTDKKTASAIEFVKQKGIPLITLDFREWCEKYQVNRRDLEARKQYFKEVSMLIKSYQADIIILSGFMLIITEPLLSEYKGRILNVHPADLRLMDGDKRKYTGLNVVKRAIEDGLPYTCSTIHVVSEKVDGGPIVAVSLPLPVEEGIDPDVHQEDMKWACDGPVYAKALEIMAEKI